MKYKILGNYFNGTFHLPPTTGPLAVENIITRLCPADISTKLWETPVDYRDIDRAVESALQGFANWKKLARHERANYLLKFQAEIEKRSEELAKSISYETGRPLWEARIEVGTVVKTVPLILEESLPRIKNNDIENVMPQADGHIYYKPLGPTCVIGPFNFPCQFSCAQMMSSLIAGNTIIFKPSEKTCYSAQIMMECFHSAGLPKGVVNMVLGDGEVGRRLVKEKVIKGVYFTGSKDVGKKILDHTHNDLSKLVTLELGGKNTAIIHEDASADHALIELIKAAFLTSGQRCTSTSLVAIHRNIYEGFIERFHDLAKKIIIDHPLDYAREPFMGPLIDQAAVDTYLLFMGMAKREGLQEIMRGKHLEKSNKGHYVSPSIHLAEKWKSDSMFLESEILGPNVTFVPYDSIDDAIKIANATEYGLAASVFTRDRDLFKTIVDEIDYGIVNLNRSTLDASARLPFGGVKNSGNYRPSGLTGIDACVYQMACLETKGEAEGADVKSIIGLDL